MTTMTKTDKPAGELVDMPASVPAVADEQGSVALMRLIERAATSPDFDVAKLDKLLDVKERWEANEARKAFVAAMTACKANPPKIVKNRHVKFAQTEYDHATLDQVAAVVGTALAEHGLSHTWQIAQHENAAVEVTCIITHEQGHSERVTMRGMPDSSGSKNLIQQIGSTTTYLQRYTLLAATGLAAGEMDIDAIGPVEFITAEQKARLCALQAEVGADTAAFLKYLKVESLDDLPAPRFDEATRALEAKRRAKP